MRAMIILGASLTAFGFSTSAPGKSYMTVAPQEMKTCPDGSEISTEEECPPDAISYKDCWDGSSVSVSESCPPQMVEDLSEAPEPLEITIYFAPDSAALVSEALELLNATAELALQYDISAIYVGGHTDTIGSASDNYQLAQLRAEAVRDALIARELPSDLIEIEALGETSLAKPTADETREPFNNRVELRIEFE